MVVSKLISIIGLVATSASLTHALGCYSGGLTFSDMTGGSVDGAIEHFCRSYVQGTVATGGTITHCYSFPENNSGDRVEMLIRNNAGSSSPIGYEECRSNFQIERTACSHGSEQNHGNFFYQIDPNDGAC